MPIAIVRYNIDKRQIAPFLIPMKFLISPPSRAMIRYAK